MNKSTDAFDVLLTAARDLGFDHVTYMAGLSQLTAGGSGPTVQQLLTHGSAPAAAQQHLFVAADPDADPDVQRFLYGHTAPFISGHNVVDLMPPLSSAQVDLLEAKAKAGFAANLFVPLPTTPFARQCFCALVYTSALSLAAFMAALTRSNHLVIALAHLFHHRAGGDANTFFDRDIAVTRFIRDLTPGYEGPLTARQRGILQAFASGERTAAVAHRFDVSPITVERHLRAIRDKLGARTTLEAVARAVAAGLIEAGAAPSAKGSD